MDAILIPIVKVLSILFWVVPVLLLLPKLTAFIIANWKVGITQFLGFIFKLCAVYFKSHWFPIGALLVLTFAMTSTPQADDLNAGILDNMYQSPMLSIVQLSIIYGGLFLFGVLYYFYSYCFVRKYPVGEIEGLESTPNGLYWITVILMQLPTLAVSFDFISMMAFGDIASYIIADFAAISVLASLVVRDWLLNFFNVNWGDLESKTQILWVEKFNSLHVRLQSYPPKGTQPIAKYCYKKAIYIAAQIFDWAIEAFRGENIKALYKGLLAFTLLLLLVAVVYPPPIVFLGAQTIVILAISVYLVLGSTLQLSLIQNKRIGLYAVPLALVVAFVFGLWNNNHGISFPCRSNSYTSFVRGNLSMDSYFKQWLDGASVTKDSTKNIILISHEGGGIRAMAWSAMLMQRFHATMPDAFYKNTFMVTGSSGGGVGATFFHTTWWLDQVDSNKKDSHLPIDNFVSQDYLSALTCSFMLGDFVQKFLPISIESLDRSKALEHDWASSYRKLFPEYNVNLDSLTYLDLYKQTKLRQPLLVANSTVMETGEKALSMAVPVDPNIYPKAKDFFNDLGRDISITTFALNFARFPIITSAGRVDNFPKNTVYHIGDAGYTDNTGLSTVWQTYQHLNTLVQTDTNITKQGFKYRFIVLFVKNGDYLETNPNSNSQKVGELSIPLSAAYKGIFFDEEFYPELFKGIEKNSFKDPSNTQKTQLEYMEFVLGRANIPSLPLSWNMSEASRKEIIKQANHCVGHLDEKYMLNNVRFFEPLSSHNEGLYLSYSKSNKKNWEKLSELLGCVPK